MAFDQPDSFQIGPFEVRPNPSPRELAEKLNKLREAVEQVRIQPGPGYTINRTRGGTTIQLLSRSGSAVRETCPFDVTIASADSSNYAVMVSPGTLNGIYASNYIDCMIFGTTTLSVGKDDAAHVILDITTDGKGVTAFSIDTAFSVSAVSPTTPLAPTSFSWPLAYIDEGKIYRTIGCHSLSAVIRESVRVVKTPATPQDNAYDIYYYWDVSSGA
jgi:hypothetical protein